MKIETIYVIENNKFGKTIGEWAEDKRIQVVATSHRSGDLSELVDGVVLFHENHNFSKEDDETQEDLSREDRKSTRLNSSHVRISYAVFCLKNKKIHHYNR